jgi:protocatechuate 3,4-dioxygenase beta subunit
MSSRFKMARHAVWVALLPFAVVGAVRAQPAVIRGAVTGLSEARSSGARASLFPLVADCDTGLCFPDTASPHEAVAEVPVDEGGFFSLHVPSPGLWGVVLHAPDRVTMAMSPVVVVEDEVDLPPAHLPEDHGVSVRVLHPEALGGFPVWVVPKQRDLTPEQQRSWHGWRPLRPPVRVGAEESLHVPLLAGEPLQARLVVGAQSQPLELLKQGATFVLDLEGLSLAVDRQESRQIEVREEGLSGGAVSGVRVLIGEDRLPIAETDGSGRAWVTFQAGVAPRLTLQSPDGRRGFGILGEPETEAAPVVITLAPARFLTGQVVDQSTHRPVRDALVWTEAGPGAWTVTDRDGFYQLLEPGTSTSVHAAASGHFPEALSIEIDGGESDRLEGPVLALDPAVRLTGDVVEEGGNPVTGAEIRMQSRPGTPMPAPYVSPSWSWADGRFLLGPLTPEVAYDLTVRIEGLAPVRRTVSSPPAGRSAPDLHVVLLQGHTVRGQVVDEEGTPVSGVRFLLLWDADARLRKRAVAGRIRERDGAFSTATDERGMFVLRHVPPGRFAAIALHAGFAPLERPGVEILADQTDLDLGEMTLLPAAVVEGCVLTARGAPIVGAQVRVSLLIENGTLGHGGIGELHSDEEGCFRVPDLAPDERIQLEVHHPDYAPRVLAEVPVPPPEPLQIVLAARTSIAGQVVSNAGQPVAGARILATPEGSDVPLLLYRASHGFDPQTQSDADGRFQIPEVEPGSLRIRARAPGFKPSELCDVEVLPGAALTGLRVVMEEGASVAGHVLDGDGQAVADAWVATQGARARTDGGGAFRLRGLAPGVRTLRAWHPTTGRRTSREIEVESAGLEGVDLVFDPAFPVSGRVTDGSAPMGGALVRMWPTAGGSSRTAQSGEDGRFQFEDVSPGSYRISAVAQGHSPSAEREVTVAEPVRGVELVLGEGATIEGRVLGLSRSKLANLTVTARRPGQRPRTALLGPDGTFRIEDLEPGKWLVTAEVLSSAGRAQERVELSARDVEWLELELDEGLILEGIFRTGGQAQAAAWITLSDLQGVVVARARSDTAGRFRLEGLSAGTYALDLATFDRSVRLSGRLDLKEDRSIELDVPLGEVSGQVRNAATSAPISRGRIRLIPETSEPQDTDLVPWVRPIGLESDGSFFAAPIPTGPYKMVVEAPGFKSAEAEVVVGPEAMLEGLQIGLWPQEDPPG